MQTYMITNMISKNNVILLAGGLIALFGVYAVLKQNIHLRQNDLISSPQSMFSTPATSSAPAITATSSSPKPAAVAKNNPPSTVKAMPVPNHLLWGAYVGDGERNLSNFEALVGKKLDIVADFEGWDTEFPSYLKTSVGQAGKTLLIFWEPDFGYDLINNGSKDKYIKQFVAEAKAYKYPVIMVPFAEMNLNEEAWGYGQNRNSAASFKKAWIRIHNLFAGVKNVKFGLAFNNVSIPDSKDNEYADYYPGSAYVDYVGVDGFDFGDPHLTFGQIFDEPMKELAQFNKPIYIFSMGAISGPGKAAWITDGLGKRISAYKNVVGWIWFNESKMEEGRWIDWTVNSDGNSLRAFKSILP